MQGMACSGNFVCFFWPRVIKCGSNWVKFSVGDLERFGIVEHPFWQKRLAAKAPFHECARKFFGTIGSPERQNFGLQFGVVLQRGKDRLAVPEAEEFVERKGQEFLRPFAVFLQALLPLFFCRQAVMCGEERQRADPMRMAKGKAERESASKRITDEVDRLWRKGALHQIFDFHFCPRRFAMSWKIEGKTGAVFQVGGYRNPIFSGAEKSMHKYDGGAASFI